MPLAYLHTNYELSHIRQKLSYTGFYHLLVLLTEVSDIYRTNSFGL